MVSLCDTCYASESKQYFIILKLCIYLVLLYIPMFMLYVKISLKCSN
jgi:hypothetical protein